MKLFTPSIMEPSSACSYVATQRGGVALLFEGHRYNKVRDGKDGTVYWRCSRDRQCPGRAVTVNNRVKKSNNKHNHPPEASLLMRNGSSNSASHHNHHSGASNNSAMAMAAAAAYASLFQGSNNHANKLSHKNSHNTQPPNLVSARPSRTSPSTASPSSSPSPLGNFSMSTAMPSAGSGGGGSLNNTPFNPFSLLQNLTNAATSPAHLLNASNMFDNGRHHALNLSANNHHQHSSGSGGGQQRSSYNHLSNLNLMANNRDSKMSVPNSPPPTPHCDSPGSNGNNNNNSLLFAKSLQEQYNNILKCQFNNNRTNELATNGSMNRSNDNGNANNLPGSLDLSPRSLFPFGGNNQFPLSLLAGTKSDQSSPPTHHHQQQQQHHLNSSCSPQANENNLGGGNMAAAFMIQDAIQEAQAAAAAAAALPSFLTETFKYLATAAATNPQMAAALASTLSSPGLLKNFDLTMATAAAAAVAAATNGTNNNNNSGGSSNGSRSCNSSTNGNALETASPSDAKLHHRSDSCDDHSPLDMSHDMTGGINLQNDLLDYSYRDEQPLNMALRDKTNVLKMLRALLQTVRPGEPFHALIVPTADAHNSEYIAPCDARREYLTGFTGSSGTAVVTLQEAALWTDGRYFLQADQQLDKQHWKLMKQFIPGTPTIGEWLNKVLQSGSRVAVDPYTFTYEAFTKLESELAANGNVLVGSQTNLVDQVWSDRPAPPSQPVVPLDISFTGKSWKDKCNDIRLEMLEKGAATLVLSALDDIAWLYNLRGSDIHFNPVFFSYAVLTLDQAYLFIDESKLTNHSLHALGLIEMMNDDDGSLSSNVSAQSSPAATGLSEINRVELRPYEMIADFLRSQANKEPAKKIWVSNKLSYALVALIPQAQRIMTNVTPVTCKKAIKNDIEIQGFRRAHVKDAIALCELFAWLEEEVTHKRRASSTHSAGPMSPGSASSHSSHASGSSGVVDELMVDAKLEEFRRQQDDYMGRSFETIAASGPNGAVIHYQSTEATNRPVTSEEMFLLDTGAQFRDGTTDVTRTIHLGSPTALEKECFTRVLKGHISLATTYFPRLTKGSFLDSFARRSLWQAGLNYNHGTGHGVGMFLNVHEGPMGIAHRINNDDPGLDVNMVLSNEPGYYEPHKFGIRIESLVVTKKVDLKYNFNDCGYLGFETITLVPIQTKLLEPSLLTSDEIEWINKYHLQCRDVVGAQLEKQGRAKALQWLMKQTEPIA